MPNIELAVHIKHKTEKALLVDGGDGNEVWIPLSQISDYTDELEIGEHITIFIPEFIAQDKGLI